MPTYIVNAINIGSFNLGEADKLLTMFCSEIGLHKAVAKGARKPGAKIAGRAELLNVNKLQLASGRTLDIITQAETIKTFPGLRKDLTRLTYTLYYAELTQFFGQGLSEESSQYFNVLCEALTLQSEAMFDAEWLCLRFEIKLLSMLGYKPETTCCVSCRQPIHDSLLAIFHQEWGGIICSQCMRNIPRTRDKQADITPLVWKHLVLAADDNTGDNQFLSSIISSNSKLALRAARRLIQGYIEHRAGKKIKSLELIC